MASTFEKPEDKKKEEKEEELVNWPKGRLIKKRLPKFGSNADARRIFHANE